MPRYLLHHHHEARDCGAAFAAFKGHPSPLRHRPALASCLSGDHSIWWAVEAACEGDAMALMPAYVSARTVAIHVSDFEIP